MDAYEAILTRRSIRKYTKDAVPAETVEKLLRAAMSAPSAGNEQLWHFVVIDDRKILDEIPKFHPYSKMLHDAPLAIAILGDTSKEKHSGFWVQDCSAATQNLLLAAHALGLGAVWLGVHPREDIAGGVRKLLDLPPEVIPLAIISIGHPGEQKAAEDRYDASKVHKNRW
ncbi:MAG: nitroreductase family protein [bacterium]